MLENTAAVEQVVSRADDLRSDLHDLESRLEELPDTIGTGFASLRGEIKQLVAEVEQQIAEAEGVHDSIKNAHETLSKEIARSVEDIDGAIEETQSAAADLASTCVAADGVLNDMLSELARRNSITGQLLLDSVRQVDQSFRGEEPGWGQGLITFLGESSDTTSNHLSASVTQMADALAQHGQQHLRTALDSVQNAVSTMEVEVSAELTRLTDAVGSLVDNHISSQVQRIQRAIARVQQTVESVQSTVKTAADLIENGVRATSTVAEQMDGANVGLKVTVGTVTKMKNVLEELL